MATNVSRKIEMIRKTYGLAALWQRGSQLEVLSLKGLVLHHLFQALRSMIRAPLTTALTVLATGVAWTFVCLMLLALNNIGAFVSGTQANLSLSLYLKDGFSEAERVALERELRSLPQVDQVMYRDKADALEQFRSSLGSDSYLLEGFEVTNPLPCSLEVRAISDSQGVFTDLEKRFSSHPLVEKVHFNRGVMQQLGEVVQMLRRFGVWSLGLVFCLAGFIVACTVKLAIYVHRDEIEIMQLLGATDWFVRAPYLIEGGVQGLCAGGLGIGLTYLFYMALKDALSSSPLFGLFTPALGFLSVWTIGALLLVAVLVAVVGAFTAVRRFQFDA